MNNTLTYPLKIEEMDDMPGARLTYMLMSGEADRGTTTMIELDITVRASLTEPGVITIPINLKPVNGASPGTPLTTPASITINYGSSTGVDPVITGEVLGASIRMVTPTGLRFGSLFTIPAELQDKMDADWEESDITFGALLIQSDKMGDLSDLKNFANPNVIDIPAKLFISWSPSKVLFTGVLISIPESGFNTKVTAIGYAKYGETIFWADEAKEQSYVGVAAAAVASGKFESGPIRDFLDSVLVFATP